MHIVCIHKTLYEFSIIGNYFSVDCWDGQKRNSGDIQDIVIYHGYTMTSKLNLRDVLYTIRHYAFINSESALFFISVPLYNFAFAVNLSATSLFLNDTDIAKRLIASSNLMRLQDRVSDIQ